MRVKPILAAITAVCCTAFGVAVLAPASAGTSTPGFTTYVAPSSLPNVDNAAEPSIGVNWNSGAAMYQAYSSTYRVTFNDAVSPPSATWSDVSAGVLINLDPILFTDSTKGRTYAGGEAGNCANLFKTDNDGASWQAMANACAGQDHETIGGGPWKGAAPLLASYDRAVYYCAQSGSAICSTSSDGGTTFGAPVTVTGACGGLHGHVKVSADGTAYLPTVNCGGKPGGGITQNNGGSWQSYTIPATVNASGFDPSVATTPDNTLYEAWADANNRPMVAMSTNKGATWSKITDLSAATGVITSTFQTVVAGDNGRIAVSYLGSKTGGNPFASGWAGVWDLYTSFSYDAGSTWTTVKVTTDPVHRGWMCAAGISCGSGRNLLDFIDSSLTKDGRVILAWADGCIGTCATASGTAAQSNAAYATISRQSTGKGLFAAYDSVIPDPTGQPTASASPTPTASPTATATATATASPTPTATATGGDPDPATPNLTNGVARSGTSSATAKTWQYYKIAVPTGKTNVKFDLATTQSCGLLGCSPDLDVYAKRAAKPTTTVSDCKGATNKSTETCSIANPASDWYYVGVYVYAGSQAQAYTIKATWSP